MRAQVLCGDSRPRLSIERSSIAFFTLPSTPTRAILFPCNSVAAAPLS
jgi:hypothetical protein